MAPNRFNEQLKAMQKRSPWIRRLIEFFKDFIEDLRIDRYNRRVMRVVMHIGNQWPNAYTPEHERTRFHSMLDKALSEGRARHVHAHLSRLSIYVSRNLDRLVRNNRRLSDRQRWAGCRTLFETLSALHESLGKWESQYADSDHPDSKTIDMVRMNMEVIEGCLQDDRFRRILAASV